VVQCRSRAGLSLEAPQTVRIRRDGLRKHLDRDLAFEPRVARPVHLSHAARAQRRQDFVRAQTSADGERHRNWCESSAKTYLTLP
jgi:hypothetical protein